MNFKSIKVKDKNRLFWVATFIILCICYFLSFSKTLEQRKIYQSLNRGYQLSDIAASNRIYSLQMKNVLLDSLTQQYSSDSVAYESNFLQNVSLALDSIPVKLSYDASRQLNNESAGVISKEIVLEGSYVQIVKALASLEKNHFVSRILYINGKYHVSISEMIVDI